MTLAAGARLGPYEVVAKLGEGGMGEVYRARDTKLNRDVALKVLPAAFSLDADRLARFTREAQTLAALNHPNIAHIHGLEESGGVRALVMELVEGEDLSAHIARGALPLDEALPIARQIAEALEAAHDQGIIHRDLKPANIKVRADGTVKVLDFGLAKALDVNPASTAADHAPTITSPAMTMRGVILGTAAYMSPEQARGKPVDRRADVWAFGVVLYEVLTGRRAFEGEDLSITLANVMKDDVKWDALPADLPPSVRRLLRRCLEKDSKVRLDSMRAARLEIDDAGREGPAATAASASQATAVPAGRGARLAWTLAALATIAAGALLVPAVRHVRETAPEIPETRLEVVTPATLDPWSFALSPDGRQIVYSAGGEGGARLWSRALNATTAAPLAGTERAGYPAWSPDGRSIAFMADGLLKRLDLGAGAPRTLAAAPNGRGATWAADGTILFAPRTDSAIFRIAASGGDPVAVTTMAAGQTGHRFPFFLPDGRHFVFFAPTRSDVGRIHLGSLDSTEAAPLTDGSTAGMYLPSRSTVVGTGWLLWERGGALVARQLDVEHRALTGDIVTIADAVARNSAGFKASVSASASGLIAYRAGGDMQRQMTWVTRAGSVVGTIGAPDENDLRDPSVSPDGRRVAVSRRVQGNIDVWILDGARATRLTFDPGPDMFPIWSPDGTRIVFRSARNGRSSLFEKALDGAASESLLVASDQEMTPTDWSADGRFLLYQSGGGSNDIWVRPMRDDTEPWIFLKTPYNEQAARFSPDGRFVAYASDESGQREVYVRPFAGAPGARSSTASGQWQVSAAGGRAPSWRADGRELYFEGLDGGIMAAPIDIHGATLEAGAPVGLFNKDHLGSNQLVRQFDVARDGRLLINMVLSNADAPITIVQNWHPPQ